MSFFDARIIRFLEPFDNDFIVGPLPLEILCFPS